MKEVIFFNRIYTKQRREATKSKDVTGCEGIRKHYEGKRRIIRKTVDNGWHLI